MSSFESKKWFVAQLKPNSHFLAKKNLEAQDFKTFLPLEEVTHRKSSRFMNSVKPFFPGYIFVYFDANKKRWTNINSTFGITRLITLKNDPHPISSEFILSLKKRCNKENILKFEQKLSSGEKVKLTKGPFTNLVGIVDKIDPQERITILFNVMGQSVKTNLYKDGYSLIK